MRECRSRQRPLKAPDFTRPRSRYQDKVCEKSFARPLGCETRFAVVTPLHDMGGRLDRVNGIDLTLTCGQIDSQIPYGGWLGARGRPRGFALQKAQFLPDIRNVNAPNCPRFNGRHPTLIRRLTRFWTKIAKACGQAVLSLARGKIVCGSLPAEPRVKECDAVASSRAVRAAWLISRCLYLSERSGKRARFAVFTC